MIQNNNIICHAFEQKILEYSLKNIKKLFTRLI